jgi:hypothetical protein
MKFILLSFAILPGARLPGKKNKVLFAVVFFADILLYLLTVFFTVY